MRKHSSIRSFLTVFVLLTATVTNLRGGEIPDAELRQEVQDILAPKIILQQPVGIEQVKLQIIAQKTVDYLTRRHIAPLVMNSELSARWYEEYFKILDYQKMYFIQEDVDEFRSYETILWDNNSRSVRIKFAFEVYQRYLERLREWTEYAVSHLYDEYDFSVEEYLELDMREQPWCASRAQREDLWRRRVKNMILAEMLRQEKKQQKMSEASPFAAATEAQDKPQEADQQDTAQDTGSSNTENTAYKIKHYTGKERLVRNYIQFYKRRSREITPIEILESFLNALGGLFDPHSVYMSPNTEEDFDIGMSNSLQGIGATLSVKDGYITVIDIMPGSPAELSGQVQVGDRIVAVAQKDGEPVDVVNMSLDKAVRLIRGPKGTEVILTIIPEGSSSEILVPLVRDKIKVKGSEAQGEIIQEPLPNGDTKNLLFIYLPAFYHDFKFDSKNDNNANQETRVVSDSLTQEQIVKMFAPSPSFTTVDIIKIITDFEKKGPIDGIILDLRGNGGGSLDEAIDLAGIFLPYSLLSGFPVVQIKDFAHPNPDVRKTRVSSLERKYERLKKNEKGEPIIWRILDKQEQWKLVDYSNYNFDKTYNYPLTILTDRFSASASEIVAACLQDAGRAVVFGDMSTHGKGSVQTVAELDKDNTIMHFKKRIYDNYNRNKKDEEKTDIVGKFGAVKSTIAKFYRISGGSTQERGVTPDIIFPSFTAFMELGENKLPNHLLYDEIRPAIYHRQSFADKYREIFRQEMQNFLDHSAEYQDYLKDLKFFEEFHQIKRLPLQLEARRLYKENEEKALDMFKKFQADRKNSRKRLLDEEEDEKDIKKEDILLHAVSAAMARGLAKYEAAVPQAAAE